MKRNTVLGLLLNYDAGKLVRQTEYGLSDGLKADHLDIWLIHRFKHNIRGQLVEKQPM